MYTYVWGIIVGLVADIDIESEKYRWMGSARLDIYVSFTVAVFIFWSIIIITLRNPWMLASAPVPSTAVYRIFCQF